MIHCFTSWKDAMGRNEEVEHPGQYCIVELQGQICTNGASSDRISKNTLKNKVVVFVIECWNETEISEGNHNENANWQA